MLTVSRLSYGATAIRQPLQIPGKPTGGDGATTMCVWTPTARQLGDASTAALKSAEAARSATTCYMRGLSESVELNTNSGASWEWRRICFRCKIPGVVVAYNDSTYGYARYWLQLTGSNSTGDTTQWQNSRDLVFKGIWNVDYDNLMTAAVDTRQVDLSYDKTMRIGSGNVNGVLLRQKRWHGMNKNLVYADEEKGSSEGTSAFSVQDKQGMGDYHIMDLFKCQTQNAGDSIAVSSCTTLYWHEK